MKIPKFEKYWLYVLIYIPLISAFWLLERFTVPKYTVYSVLDSYIPFIPVFSVFYFIWFLYMAAATAFFMFYSKEDFMRLTTFIAVGMAFCFVLYIVFPNEQPLRPADTGSGVFGALVKWLYSIDTPTNVCPSIHVVNTIAVHACICKSDLLSEKRGIKTLSFVTMVLINLSTMLIKQHSIIDAFFGLLTAVIIYCAIFAVCPYLNSRKLCFEKDGISDIIDKGRY